MIDCIHRGEYKGEMKVYCVSGDEEYRPFYICSLHTRCVPKISGKASMIWEERPESKLVKWCHTCVDKVEPASTER